MSVRPSGLNSTRETALVWPRKRSTSFAKAASHKTTGPSAAPLARRFPGVAGYRLELAIALRELALAQHVLGQTTIATENLDEAIRVLTALTEQYPQIAEYGDELDATKAVTLAPPQSLNSTHPL